jgi:hypothetical protein
MTTIGFEKISTMIDNNSVFWNNLNDLIEETIKEKYSK